MLNERVSRVVLEHTLSITHPFVRPTFINSHISFSRGSSQTATIRSQNPFRSPCAMALSNWPISSFTSFPHTRSDTESTLPWKRFSHPFTAE